MTHLFSFSSVLSFSSPEGLPCTRIYWSVLLQVIKVHLDLRGSLDHRDYPDHRVHQDFLDKQDHKDPKVKRAILVPHCRKFVPRIWDRTVRVANCYR